MKQHSRRIPDWVLNTKTFKKDINVKKIDVDLSKGKVLIAYNNNKKIKFDEIKEKILINGQNAIDMAILNL